MTKNAQVEQRHRDAAADLHSDGFVKDAFRLGQYDDTELPQAFARFEASLHRLGQEFDAGEAVAKAVEPWKDFHGDLPDYDHPLRCVYESGIQYAVDLLARVLKVEDYEICDGTEEFDGDLGGTMFNIVLAALPKDEHGDALHPSQLHDIVRSASPPPAQADADLIERAREAVINNPETADFMAGVPVEAAHQRERWGVDHDAGKTPFAWLWLIGHLAQKAADAASRGDVEKAKHHTISTAAALANWHAALTGADTRMRPGTAPPAALSQEGK